MNPIDYMELLGALPDDLVDCAFSHQAKAAGSAVPQEHAPITVQVKTGTAIPLKKRGSVWAPRIVSGAAAAACLAVVCGMGILLRDDGMTMQTSTMETVVAPETDLPAATTAPAVTAAPQHSEVPAQTAQTALTVQTTAALPAETTAQPAETAPAATEAPDAAAPAETTPAETTPAPAETAPAETAPAPAEPQTPVFELGDVDMDGKITFVDAALVFIDIQLADVDRLDLSLLTDEQRALGDVDGKMGGLYHWRWDAEKQEYESSSEPFVFSHSYKDSETNTVYKGDADIIERVAILRNWCGLSDLTISEYLARQEYYDDFQVNWSQNADSESAQKIADALGLYRLGLKNAIWKTKYQEDHPDWTGTKDWIEHSVLFDSDVLYDAGDFLRMAEEMREYF
ncbi:MAG: hypothetical protein IKI77_01570 [Oscillospiraceae bacterium]|nr:hypothetical protein [Oscillospiraceae bacterium]